MITNQKAILALEDGSVFEGVGIGAEGSTVGELVFNTAMTGYQEILTDPSYAKQIVTLTYPHIGNTGCNAQDFESEKAQAAGLVIRDLPLLLSNYRSEQTLTEFLQEQNIVAIAGVDTRALTRRLREKGALSAAIGVGDAPSAPALITQAKAFPGLKGMDLAREVTTAKTYEWTDPEYDIAENAASQAPDKLYHVVAYDYGVKRNILRMLRSRGCRITVVPAQTPAEEVLKHKPDGVFLSNGPGDPEPCDYAISAIQTLLEKEIPVFGICLGHQLLALAAGAKSMKMKFGHHGANHPVLDIASGKVMITSQNHGFAIDESTLPDNMTETHRSLFDNTVQGVALTDKPAFGFQGHPEASPGPHDVAHLFDQFIANMERANA